MRRGITLFETLVALAMISVCLAVIASLYASASRAMSQDVMTEDAVRSLSLLSDRVVSDIEQATSVEATGGELRLERADGSAPLADATLPLAADARLAAPVLVPVRIWHDPAGRVLVRDAGGGRLALGHGVVEFRVMVGPATGPSVDERSRVDFQLGMQGPDGAIVRLSNTATPRVHGWDR